VFQGDFKCRKTDLTQEDSTSVHRGQVPVQEWRGKKDVRYISTGNTAKNLET